MNESHEIHTCEVCGARVNHLRRGRCWICYIRWAEARQVGLGAACVICNDRRHENLRLVEFRNAWLPMCHNCGAKAMRITPMPHSIEGLRQRLCRDRRWNDRRGEMPEAREDANREQRVGERRAIDNVELPREFSADELIIEIIEAEDAQGAVSEATCIAPLPAE